MRKAGKVSGMFGLSVILMLVLFTFPASAHFMWINVENFTPSPEGKVSLNIGWGHRFGNPVGNVMRGREGLDEIAIVSPGGDQLKVEPLNETDYKVEKALGKDGTYLAVAKRKEGFFSKTTEGYQRQSKKGLKNVIQCSYSGGYAKAIINAGKAGGAIYAKAFGHPLEIIPLKDPADLRQGDYLPIKVLYNGEPLRTEIYATYAGFSTEGAWAFTTGVDKEGLGRVKILQPGVWLIKVNHKTPYPDPKECDQYSYTATLTFEVK